MRPGEDKDPAWPAAPSEQRAADDGDAEGRTAEAWRAEQRYIDDLLVRGEAVPEGEPLPPGATHEIVLGEDGRRTARRRRFTAY